MRSRQFPSRASRGITRDDSRELVLADIFAKNIHIFGTCSKYLICSMRFGYKQRYRVMYVWPVL